MSILKIKNSVEKISKMVFLLFCLVVLVQPLLNINKAEISNKEKRSLAKYKPLYEVATGSINFHYGTDFENYLKDRFWGRETLIKFNQTMVYFLSYRYVHLNKIVIDKFKREMNEILEVDNLYKDTEQRIIAQEIQKFCDYLRDKKVEVYFVVLPTKDMIEPIEYIEKSHNAELQGILNNLRRDSGADIIFPLNNLMHKKKFEDPFFYKTDLHLTDYGSFIAYNALIERIRKDFPDVNALSISEFNYTQSEQTAYMEDRNYNIGGCFRKTLLSDDIGKQYLFIPYKYYTHKDRRHLQKNKISTDKLSKNIYIYESGSEHRVLVFGDSSIEKLMIFLPFSFKHTNKIRINGLPGIKGTDEQFKILKYYKQEIESFHPDIIIIYIGYGHLEYLRNIAKEK